MAATAPTLRRPGGAVAGAVDVPSRRPDPRAGALLLGALLAVLAYAVFADGAASYPDEARVQVALCAIAIVGVAAVVWRGAGVAGSSAGWAGLTLLGAFAAWSGLSLAWSVAPSGTWTELNRAIAYVLVVGLALVAGSWHPRAVRHAALGLSLIHI